MTSTSAAATILAVAVLVAVLAFAVVRPRGWPEVYAAAPGAAVVVLLGLVSWPEAAREVATLGPTVGFLAAILVLAHLADEQGLFRYAGAVAARLSRGSPRRLFAVVFAIAAGVTAVLSLDATVVLLTPVVLATAARVNAPAKPHAYACTHLANSASLPLPVSNLTNLLAFAASGLTFTEFAGLMALPWLAVIAVEYAVLRAFFAGDLPRPATRSADAAMPPVPRLALAVVGATLVGFAIAEPLGVAPVWVAAAGAAVLATPRLVRQPRAEAVRIVRAANLGFCAFVFALGIVVLAIRDSAVGRAIDRLIPAHADLAGLAVMAVVAAVLANLLNNLPATLVLVPLATPHPGLVLAVLLGVNIGPNLTYVGSLANLLWRGILHARGHAPAVGEFLRVGALTVPATLTAGVLSLWLALTIHTG
jgi:arsenical pump membrane protein